MTIKHIVERVIYGNVPSPHTLREMEAHEKARIEEHDRRIRRIESMVDEWQRRRAERYPLAH